MMAKEKDAVHDNIFVERAAAALAGGRVSGGVPYGGSEISAIWPSRRFLQMS